MLLSASLLALMGVAGFDATPAYAVDPHPVDCKKGIVTTISGQVSQAFLYADDGTDTDTFIVDNDNASTRIRAVAVGHINCDWTVGANFEVEWEQNNTKDIAIDQASPVDSDGDESFKKRKMEVWFKGPMGKFSIGQGDTASNGTSEVDLSKTGVVAYSDIAAFMGGISFVGIGATAEINDFYSNFDGLSRTDRVRYDTPTFAGFTLSTSFTDQQDWDVALRYAGEFGAIRVAAAAAYADQHNDLNTDFDSQYNGSISILHTPTGLNVTAAYGAQEDVGLIAGRDSQFYYFKLGWIIKNANSLGPIAISVDYGRNEDLDGDGDELKTYSFAIVQHIPYVGTELYAAARTHEAERAGFADPDEVYGIMAGARVKF